MQAQETSRDAIAALNNAQEQLQRADTAEDRIAALTGAVLAFEAGLKMIRAAERDVGLQEIALSEDLAAQEARIADLVAMLTTISRSSEAVRQAHPGGPLASIRAGMLLADIAPVLEAEAAEVAGMLQSQQELRAEQREVSERLQSGLDQITAARRSLALAMDADQSLPFSFEDNDAEVAALAQSAENLAAFADRLAQTRPDPVQVLEPAGNLPLPVAGIILPTDGSGRPGVRIAAPPRALVTTPVAATVLFDGPLLDYGNIVILEPAPDVLFVIAGLEEVLASAGQILPADAPLGLLPDKQTYDDGILTENLGLAVGQRAQSLYLEVREGQSAVQTDRWFALE
ncbi:murein hydrolase activator EnvC family protein [Yoonia litorea]|uniref:murein hydrolase activator EnvC family protein n=1 Tax=Yoonia litorea TaxID=1123755 RepID=UPI001F615448|nr:hypothetical protein [Yoonia litorea]